MTKLNHPTCSFEMEPTVSKERPQSLRRPQSHLLVGGFFLEEQNINKSSNIDVVASNTCGFCSGSIGVVYRSDSLSGPWERNIVSAYSCGGQVEGVLPLTDPITNETTYVWHATTMR